MTRLYEFIHDYVGNRLIVILQRDYPNPGLFDFLVKNTSNGHVIVYEGFNIKNSKFLSHHDYGRVKYSEMELIKQKFKYA